MLDRFAILGIGGTGWTRWPAPRSGPARGSSGPVRAGPGPARCSSGPAITGPVLHRAGGCASRWPHGPQWPLQARSFATGGCAACRRASGCCGQGTGPGGPGFPCTPNPRPSPDPPPKPAGEYDKTGKWMISAADRSIDEGAGHSASRRPSSSGVRVTGERGDSCDDGSHTVLIMHVATRRYPRRRGPLNPQGPSRSNSAAASSCETAPSRPAATHSR